jgi:hypothetical protein
MDILYENDNWTVNYYGRDVVAGFLLRSCDEDMSVFISTPKRNRNDPYVPFFECLMEEATFEKLTNNAIRFSRQDL